MSSPFILTSWQNSFLELLLNLMAHETNEVRSQDLSHLTFIVPHKRPQLYLMERLKIDSRFAKPCVLPHFVSAQELFPALRESLFPHITTVARQLDMVALLLESVRQLPDADALLFKHTAQSGDSEVLTFLPWGLRLAGLFEECFTHNVKPENFLYEEYQVTQYAAKLLSNIGTIFTLYTRLLDERQWTTPGYDAFRVMHYLAQHGDLPEQALWHALRYRKREQQQLFIAGFFALSGAENTLFRHLWKTHGAQVLLQGDTADNPHWSCEPLMEWARQWKAVIHTIPSATQKAPFSNLHFVAGFDLHSQLTKIHDILQQETSYGNTGKKGQQQASSAHTMPLSPRPATDASQHALGALEAPRPSSKKRNEKKEKPSQGALNAATQLSLFALPPQREPAHRSAEQSNPHAPEAISYFAADTVIVLPDTGLLMPALHHLPQKNINISMGYPLRRSSLFGLLDSLIQLQKNKSHGLYYWRDIVNIIRHPYIKMLRFIVTDDENNEQHNDITGENDLTLRKALHLFEEALRNSNQSYIDPRQFFIRLSEGQQEKNVFPLPLLQFLVRLERTLLHNFAKATTPFAIAGALHHFCKLLLTYGKQLWKQFPIDAECLFRLHSSIIPELSQTALSHETLSSEILYSLLHTLIENERVPFEATPLVGLQLLGMLETRLLDFRRVIIPECTDDLLPGIAIEDPLLPDPLRLEIGLPSRHKREEVVAYHFYRLLACADEVILLWQEGSETTGLLDTRKRRSRFVEELVWRIEKERHHILSPGGDGPLEVLATTTTPIHTQRTSIDNTPVMQSAVRQFLTKPVSATALDCYLSCPAKFILRYILKIDEASEVVEGQDLPKIGNAIHTTLYTFYQSRLGQDLPEGNVLYENSFDELLHIFHSTKEYDEIKASFPADVYTLFSTAGEIRLREYLKKQPATKILTLEKSLNPQRPLGHSELDCIVHLHGRADRIDIRQEIIHILDYKTGGFLPEIRTKVWEDQKFWDEVAFWTPDASKDPLPSLSSLFPSIQLPFYIALFQRLTEHERKQLFERFHGCCPTENEGIHLVTASWVAIGSDGQEKSLFTNFENYEYVSKQIVDNIEALLSFLIRHMLSTPSFFPHEGAHCVWCPYLGRCTALQ